MAAGLVEKTVGGKKYEFQKFGASQSLKVLAKLSKVLLEPMSLAFSAMEGSGGILDRKINGDVVGKAARALVDRLDDSVIDLIKELIGPDALLCDGKKIVFDSHYEDLGHLFEVLQAALEVQYGNFFAATLGKAGLSRKSTTPGSLT